MIKKLSKYERLLSYFLSSETLSLEHRLTKIAYYVSAIAELLDVELAPIRNIGTHPAEVRRILESLRPVVQRLLKLVPKLIEMQGIDKIRLISFLAVLYEASISHEVRDIFENMIENVSDEIVLSEIADVSYDIGLFDIAYKALLKLYNMGDRRIEIVYNIALLEYMMGRNESALTRLLKLSKNRKAVSFGIERISYLMGAVYLSRGDVKQAKQLFKIARKY